MEKTWCFFLNYLQKRRRHYLNKALLHPETQAVEKRLIEKKMLQFDFSFHPAVD